MVLVAVTGLAGCRAPADDLGGRTDRSLAAAMHALVRAQSPDGAWHSPTYGVFRDGLALTPSVLKAVAFGPDVQGAGPARHRGAAYVAGRVRFDGSIDTGPFGLTYLSSTLFAVGALRIAGIDPFGSVDRQGPGLPPTLPEPAGGRPGLRPGVRRRRLLFFADRQGRRGGQGRPRSDSLPFLRQHHG
jgi:hypothetical protein